MNDLNNVHTITLALANKVYVMENFTINSSFKQVAEKLFYSESETVNFANSGEASEKINTWVAEKTNDKIQNVINPSSLNLLTRMVLVNAIYFKGNWLYKFNEENTRIAKFHTSKTTSVDCQKMFKEDQYGWCFISELSAAALSIRYKNADFSMIIILPKTIDGIDNLEKAIQKFDLTNLNNKMVIKDVKVSLPKFKIETTMNLKEPLMKMGLKIIFDDELADFSGLINGVDDGLAVSHVIQKAFIEVNEEGAEAAAEGAAIVRARSASLPSCTTFCADHPFLFYLMKNDQCLFSGKMANPST